jgi:site-specific recombinase XerD
MDPRPLAPDQETRALVDDFLQAQLRPRTRSTYETDVAVFFGWLGRRGVHPLAVGRRDIDRYRNWMSELVDADGKPTLHGQPRFAPATVAKRLSAVRSFYGYVVDRGTIDASPAVGVKVPRTPREPRGHAITENQVAKLIAAAQEHSDTSEAIVRLLVTNGLRVSEVCAALVELLEREPDGGLSLQVHGKGGKLARVALNEGTARAVRAVAGGRDRGVLFERQDRRRTRHGHDAPRIPYTQQAVSRLLVELARGAGLLGTADGEVDRMHPHRLRHTFVTILLDRGQGLAAVQDAARHASADTTRLYDRRRDAYRTHPTHELVF